MYQQSPPSPAAGTASPVGSASLNWQVHDQADGDARTRDHVPGACGRPRAVIYVCLPLVTDADLARQMCEQFAANYGWSVARVEYDRDTGAYPEARRGLRAALRDVQCGGADAVLVPEERAVSRDPDGVRAVRSVLTEFGGWLQFATDLPRSEAPRGGTA